MRLLSSYLGAILLALFTSYASANDYPTRPIVMVVPVPAGGAIDMSARRIGKLLGDKLGKPIVIDNKPGAGGIVGTEYVVGAKPDGYTILYNTHAVLVTYEKWTVGRITLLGDACHPMLPMAAQGAAQAIEDGATLAGCLAGVSSTNAASALQHYEALRRPRTTSIQTLSRDNRIANFLPDGPEQRNRDAEWKARGLSPRRKALFSFNAEILDLPSGAGVN